MNHRVVIFDDCNFHNFHPLTLVRSTGELRVGAFTQRQRIEKFFGVLEHFAIVDPSLVEFYRYHYPNWSINFAPPKSIFVNSRIKMNKILKDEIELLENNQCLKNEEGSVIAAKTDLLLGDLSPCELNFKNFSCLKIIKNSLFSFWWELIATNSIQIEDDFRDFFEHLDNISAPDQFVTMINPYKFWIAENVKIAPNVILDAKNGPIIIEKDVTILPNSLITGPCYIGQKTTIKPFSDVGYGSSFGGNCKIAGEVHACIIDDFSNKQHFGFLGESYIGSWVNIGAGTTCSNLKNNYGKVKSYFNPKDKIINTQRIFLGCLIAHYCKIGINSTINTGANIGLASSIYGKDLIDGYIKSFSFGSAKSLEKYNMDKFFATLEVVKKRRNQKFSITERNLIKKIWE